MGSEHFQPSWPFYSVMNSSPDEVGYYGLDMVDSHVDACDFSASFITQEDISDTCSIPFFSNMLPSEFDMSPACPDPDNLNFTVSLENFLRYVEEFEPNSSDDMDCVCEDFSNSCDQGNVPSQSQEMSSEREVVWSPSLSIKSNETTMETVPIPAAASSLILPGDDFELENQSSVLHLLKAYGEAMETGQKELADVVMRCVSEKVSPAGETLERFAFILSHDLQKQGNYLRQESCKNFEAAFRAFYQIFPYGRFAHFAANSAILEAMPADADSIHIVDFDIGEGIQWPPMIEALAQQHKPVRLTALKWETEDCDPAPSMWSFEQVRRQLIDHAKLFGLRLKVEEMQMEDLVTEMNKTKKRAGKKEWLAFNCMTGLPHMGRIRSRKLVQEFLRVAEVYSDSSSRGILSYGHGNALETLKSCSGFGSFFDRNMSYHQFLLQSMESSLPVHLSDARTALECLFVAPYISSQWWFQQWTEIREGCYPEVGTELQGWRVSRESLEEAREMLKEKTSYGVRIGGNQNNEMILEWKGTPLVKVSTWRK